MGGGGGDTHTCETWSSPSRAQCLRRQAPPQPSHPGTAPQTQVYDGGNRGLGARNPAALSPTAFSNDPELVWFPPRPHPSSGNENNRVLALGKQPVLGWKGGRWSAREYLLNQSWQAGAATQIPIGS